MQKVRVRAKRDEGHRIIPASGVWGGVTPQGMIYFDLFLEKPETPAETLITIDEKTGQRMEQPVLPEEPCLERLLLMGITVRPEVARSIGQWLIERADEAMVIGEHPPATTMMQ
jgi:hypothetical protein